MTAAPADLLANERTFLAYVRTALSLQLAGLAVFQFLDVAHHVVRPLLGLTLVGIGSYGAAAGLMRYRLTDRNLRSDADITTPASPQVVALAVFRRPPRRRRRHRLDVSRQRARPLMPSCPVRTLSTGPRAPGDNWLVNSS